WFWGGCGWGGGGGGVWVGCGVGGGGVGWEGWGWGVLWRVIVVLSEPGIIAGCLLVFIPALGAYVTPLILGGGVHLMIGDLIAQQFGVGRNWPLGSAQALILMAAVLVALYFYVRATAGQVKHG